MSDVSQTKLTPTRRGWASLADLNGYQWFVFLVAATAWLADCMDQQIFNLARRMSISDLLHESDPALKDKLVTSWTTNATAAFLVGWATGGLIFGVFGDRIGRVRTLMWTVLLYSILTGLSAASQSVWDYTLYRFLTGLGVGGVFGAAVSLLAETMPSNARPYTLSLMQAMSTVGNCAAALLFIGVGLLQPRILAAWRIMFLVGIVPAALVVFIQRWLHEPESWVRSKKAAEANLGQRLGSYRDLFAQNPLRRYALLGMVLSAAGVVGLWGVGFFAVDLQQKVFESTYAVEATERGLTSDSARDYMHDQRIIWAGITSLLLNFGGFFGMTSFGWLAVRYGRRPVFAAGFVAAGTTIALLFLGMRTKLDILWMTPIMGFCLLAPFGGYAIYLPELFPTRLRATGTSFCYNVGRFVAATGPLMLGFLTNTVFALFKEGDATMPARLAGAAMCGVFFIGLAVLPFLPETRGEPLPE
ncbi:MAG: MFS transporter [Gemmataceae bacterium]